MQIEVSRRRDGGAHLSQGRSYILASRDEAHELIDQLIDLTGWRDSAERANDNSTL